MTVDGRGKGEGLTDRNNGDYSSPANALQEKQQFFRGVRISGFSQESIAKKAGLEKDDIIVKCDDVGNLTRGKLELLTMAKDEHKTSHRIVFVRGDQWRSIIIPHGFLGIHGENALLPGHSEPVVPGENILFYEISLRQCLVVVLLFVVPLPILTFLVPAEWRDIGFIIYGIFFIAAFLLFMLLILYSIWQIRPSLFFLVLGGCGISIVTNMIMSSMGWTHDDYRRWVVGPIVFVTYLLVGSKIIQSIEERKSAN